MVIFELTFITLEDETVKRTITSDDYYFNCMGDLEMWSHAADIGLAIAESENMILDSITCIAC